MVHGRDQRTELIEENTSMMLKRNLLALLPPGSQLTDCISTARAIKPNTPVAVVTLLERTPKEEYALQRQSRTIAYCKQREDFFEGNTTTPYTMASVSAKTTSKPLQSCFRSFEPPSLLAQNQHHNPKPHHFTTQQPHAQIK
jgi:hypothetical protein